MQFCRSGTFIRLRQVSPVPHVYHSSSSIYIVLFFIFVLFIFYLAWAHQSSFLVLSSAPTASEGRLRVDTCLLYSIGTYLPTYLSHRLPTGGTILMIPL